MGVLLLMTTGNAQAEPASAKPACTGQDYSGVYDCTGNDTHAGKHDGGCLTGNFTLNARYQLKDGCFRYCRSCAAVCSHVLSILAACVMNCCIPGVICFW